MSTPLFDPERNPFDDIREAIALAHKEHKNVLLDIGGDWCIWCRRLEDFIESHPELAKLRASHYVAIKVYVDEKNDTNQAFMSQLPPINGVPHLFVYSGRGLLLCSQPTNPFEEGDSYNYERIHAFLTEWSDWRRSPYDAMTTDELRQRFNRHMRPYGNNPALSA